MLHHWLIAVPKTPQAESSIVDRISATLAQFLYYRPDCALLHRFDQGYYVMSVSAGTDVWRMAPPYSLAEDGFVAVSGVPTLEAVANAEESIPASIRRLFRAHGPDRIYETVGGSFSVGCLDALGDGRVRVSALSDFSGYNSLFYLDSPEYFAVGNRASFVGALRSGYPGRSEMDADVLSWLLGTTMIMGTKTPFSGVSRLRTGYRISLDIEADAPVQSATISRMSPHHFDGGALSGSRRRRWFPFGRSRSSKPEGIEAVDFEAISKRMADRVTWCVNRGVKFRAHLTGGRDTRVIAGILASQGVIDAIDRFTSLGTEENGDVIVARAVAKSLGLGERHVVAPGGKTVSTLSAAELHTALRRSTFLYDGHLSAWDGRRTFAGRVPPWVMLMGGGGEIYRQEWGSSDALTGDDAPRRALNMFARHDALGLLSDTAREYQSTEIAQALQLLRNDGAVNLACAFYMEERLANWGCGHFTNGVFTPFPLLLDRELARFVFAIDDVSEDVHFEMLRHCGQGLLSVPFLNKEWAPSTEQRARQLGLAPKPISVKVERSFPWQFACYRTFRNAIIDFCLECGSSLQSQVPTARLEQLRRSPIEPFGSAHVKMLFGLCGAVCLVTGASGGKRDLTTGSVRMAGNQVARIATAIEDDEVETHDVAERLWAHLRAAAPKEPTTA